MSTFTIRPATLADVPRQQTIFAAARQFMRRTGNPHQWADDYPSTELLERDIASGDSYVCLVDGRIVATFVLRPGADPTYSVIFDGAWLNDRPYATIHRIASDGTATGIFDRVVRYALSRHTDLRIDTHRDNAVMRHLVAKAGFHYCGIIHCWSGDERLAFQLSTT